MSSSTGITGILDLPAELRAHILSFILPDLSTIECDIGWSPTNNDPPRNCPVRIWTPDTVDSVHRFRSDDEKCDTAVLRICKQLNQDGTGYLYHLKTYKVHVFNFGIDFLSQAGDLHALPLLPYHEMKEFVIQIVGCGMAESGCRLRENLLWLCGLLNHHKVHLRKLRIEFPEPYASIWNSESVWDEDGSEEERWPPVIDESVINDCNANLAAWEAGFPSTFAYILSPLALLPTADECTIELPECFKAKQHVVDAAKWYEEGISGVYPFEEDWCLKQDRAEFEYRLQHPDGLRSRQCDCADCVLYYEVSDGREEECRKQREQIEEERVELERQHSTRAGSAWLDVGWSWPM
ncbi:MAG: hypothetical protein LQ338_007821 [Usnochroma carphineum]|nr:MAG: hypothetical protein LQ338_007821 [Usnochroma carphineum]